MAKESAFSEFAGSLFTPGLYKPTQGRMIRQVTGASIALIAGAGCYSLYVFLVGSNDWIKFSAPTVLFILMAWLAFRVVNWPQFADFLIATEAELRKVTWPTRDELIRGTVVVLVVMFSLAMILFLYDAIWIWLFDTLGVLQRPDPVETSPPGPMGQ